MLDQDKQLSFDTARLEYSHSVGLLFADIDELLFSPKYPNNTLKFVENEFKYSQKYAENIRVPRYNIAAKTNNLKIRGTNKTDREIVPILEKCVQSGNLKRYLYLYRFSII